LISCFSLWHYQKVLGFFVTMRATECSLIGQHEFADRAILPRDC